MPALIDQPEDDEVLTQIANDLSDFSVPEVSDFSLLECNEDVSKMIAHDLATANITIEGIEAVEKFLHSDGVPLRGDLAWAAAQLKVLKRQLRKKQPDRGT